MEARVSVQRAYEVMYIGPFPLAFDFWKFDAYWFFKYRGHVGD
jgi:hypothetical protein